MSNLETRNNLIDLKSNPEWWKQHPDATYDDWWRYSADEVTMTLEEVLPLIEAESNRRVVAELEKLKKERHLETENNGTMYYSVDVEVIDNRISQLKGEV